MAPEPRQPVDVYLALGSNVGDRLAQLRGAVAGMAGLDGFAVTAVSAVYETEALVAPGAEPQRDHLNAVVAARTDWAPLQVLHLAKALEQAAGRDPAAARWAPRPLDVDVLLFGDRVLAPGDDLDPPLVVPHPELAARRFVLAPLAEVAAEVEVPGTGRTVADLLAACPDDARVERTDRVLHAI